MITEIFRYIEPLWLGHNKKLSARRFLALVFSYDFIRNTSYAIHKWEIGKSYADVAMLLGIEAALIAAMLSLTTYSSSLLNNSTITQSSSSSQTITESIQE
jgi:hypothetical protein